MTASQAETAQSSWSALVVWNCAPVAVSKHLESHALRFRPEHWTQEDQIALWREAQSNKQIKFLTFSIWPLLVGLAIGGMDFLACWMYRKLGNNRLPNSHGPHPSP
jgi:nitrate reductase NapE component